MSGLSCFFNSVFDENSVSKQIYYVGLIWVCTVCLWRFLRVSRHELVLTLLGKVLKKTLFAINVIKLVLTLLGKVLKKTLFAIKALIANRVFFKTLPRSVKTSFMTKGHGQGVRKRKNY